MHGGSTVNPRILRRVSIATYEAEMNIIIFAKKGRILVRVEPGEIWIEVQDSGPGIPDIKKAMKLGYSTAPNWVREMGFGAGMGLNNIQKCADNLGITSTVGKGTKLEISVSMRGKK